MLRNYFKIAWRNLLRQKLTSVINLFGLALGLYLLPADRPVHRATKRALTASTRRQRTLGVWSGPFLNRADKAVLPSGSRPLRRLSQDLLRNDFPEIRTVITALLSNGQTAFHFGEKAFQ
jgi:hypothetical protein